MRQQEFHAVLCDIMMPEMNGLECLAQTQVEGLRRAHLVKSVLQIDPEISERIKKDERYISLMKATNNMKRTGST